MPCLSLSFLSSPTCCLLFLTSLELVGKGERECEQKRFKILLVLSTVTLVVCSRRHFGDPRHLGTSPCSSPGVGNALAKTLSLIPSAARRTPKVCPCCYLLRSYQPVGQVFCKRPKTTPHSHTLILSAKILGVQASCSAFTPSQPALLCPLHLSGKSQAPGSPLCPYSLMVRC